MMKGIYLLLISIKKDVSIRVGKLGEIEFKKGKYCYVGSAQRNLERRIERHFKIVKKTTTHPLHPRGPLGGRREGRSPARLKTSRSLFWHIDYLLANKNTKIEKVFCFPNKRKNQECKMAKLLSKYGKPIKNFGSSDCKCKSHLLKIKKVI